MNKRYFVVLGGVTAAVAACAAAVVGGSESQAHWELLTTGSDLSGWTIGTESGHGDTQGWTIQDGTITGTQDKTGNGGILYTDKTYGDFVLDLELNPDWGLDSGIFLRSTKDGKCYQIVVDNYEGGNIGGIYGEGIGGFFARSPNWTEIFKQGEWNHLQAVVRGNPPTIDVFINGAPAMSWKGEETILEAEGHLAVQVHAGDQYFGKETRFRNIRVQALD